MAVDIQRSPETFAAGSFPLKDGYEPLERALEPAGAGDQGEDQSRVPARLEAAEQDPSARRLERLAKALGVPVTALLE